MNKSMPIPKKRYKKEWFKISEIIDLLKKRNKESGFSAKHILNSATLSEPYRSTKVSGFNSSNDLDEDIRPELWQPSPENISIYFYTLKVVDANVLDCGDDEIPICHISISGYIPLNKRCIQDLINTGESYINMFILPSQQRIYDRQIFKEYIKDEEGYFDTRQAHPCEIYKEQQPVIRNSGIGNLYIYRADAIKLVQTYWKIIPKKYTRKQETKHTPEKNKRKISIKEYRRAAAICLARALWEKYPNLTPSKLSELRPFYLIFEYKNPDIDNDKKFEEQQFRTITNPDLNNEFQDPPYKTIVGWVKKSYPSYLIKSNRPTKELKACSKQNFELMVNETSHILDDIVKNLLDSIEYHNSKHNKKNQVEENNSNEAIINLDIIADKVKSDPDELSKNEFWTSFWEINPLFPLPEAE
jgi:hypothetical protein